MKTLIRDWRAVGVSQFVYFIQAGDDGPVKIGTAVDPIERLGQLQPGNAVRLRIRHVVPGDYATETALHRHFADFQLVGEWFDNHAVVLAWGAEMEARAHAHLAENGLPPVAWIRCVEPLDAVQRVVLWERIRLARKARIPASRMSQEITRYGNDPTFHGVDWESEWALCRLAEKAVAA